MTSYKVLKERLQNHVVQAKEVARRADESGRDYYPSEEAEVQRHLDAVRGLVSEMKIAKADDRVKAQLSALGGDVDSGLLGSGYGGFAPASGYKAGGSAWAEGVARQLTKAAHAAGTKDISASQLGVPSVVEVAVQIPTRPARLLDLIPTKSLPGNTFAYARQVAAVNNAAPVADHAIKPTSTYTFLEVEDRAHVIAHITAPVALRILSDHDDLIRVIDDQMRRHVLEEIEDQMISGDGTGENFTGLMHASGTLATSYAVSVPATLRAARLQLETSNIVATAWLMSPTDVAALDLLADTQERFYNGEIDKLMGNLPKVSTTAIPPGQAILGDWSQSRLYVREEANLAIDTAGDLFKKNEAVLRYEGRYGFAVLQPSAYTIVDLTA